MQTHDGSAQLTPGERAPLTGGADLGTGRVEEPEREALSELIRRFNERHGTEFADEDVVRLTRDMMEDPLTVDQARANPSTCFSRCSATASCA